jgi:hypothetical protein
MLYVEESLNFLSEGEIEHALDVERPRPLFRHYAGMYLP